MHQTLHKTYLRYFSISFLIVFGSFLHVSTNAQARLEYKPPGTYTFTVPSGVTSITVEIWGAGGAGGGAFAKGAIFGSTSRGGGGGGGAYKKMILSGLTSGTTYSFTVGAGGAGVNGDDGGDGEASVFNGMVVNGGSGGKVKENGNGDGGAGATGGDRNGGNGANATSSGSGGGGGGAGATANGANGKVTGGGNGGAGGGGKGGDGKTSNNNGDIGAAPGGGGGGGYFSGFWTSGSQFGGNGGDGQIVITFSCGSAYVWIGNVDNNWFTAGNWCNNQVPLFSSNVYIPTTSNNMPNINAAGAVCNNITIDGSLTLLGNNTLTVNGNWTNNGNFSPSNKSTVRFTSGNNYTIDGSVKTIFNILTVDKSGGKLTSITKAFGVNDKLNISNGNLALQAFDDDYSIGGDLTVSSGATLTHSVNWDSYGKSLNVSGNIDISGTLTYTVRSTVRMVGAGNKTVKSNSPFSIFLLQNGNYSAASTLTINDNFWPMFGTGGNFYTNGQTVNAKAGVLINGGAVNINGGTLNISGGLIVGNGQAGTVNFTSGTLNTDQVIIGNGVAGTFNMSGSSVANLTGNWTNNGTLNVTAGPVNMIGTTAQTIGGNNTSTFYDLLINNTAGVTLSKDITVNNTLDLTNGLVTTNAFGITITANGNTINYSNSSYINGRLIRVFPNSAAGALTFPTGKGGNYRPLTFAFTSGGANRTIAVEQMESAISGTLPLPELDLFGDRYWEITKSGGANSTFGYKVTLDATGFTPAGVVTMVKKEGNSASLSSNTTVSLGNFYTNATAFTTFSNATSGTGTGTNQFAFAQICKAANAGPATSPICAEAPTVALGGSVSGTATGGVWSSSVGGTFNPNENTLNATWTPPTGYSGTAVLTLTTVGGVCDDKSSSKNQVVKPLPVITLNADYCNPTAPNEVILKGTSNENISNNYSNWTWTGGSIYSQTYGPQFANAKTTTNATYTLQGKSASSGCIGSASVTVNIGVQPNLITNGDFEQGNVGFTSTHNYVTVAGGLNPENTYAIGSNPNFYHTNFWGWDHTKQNGTGQFMLINVNENVKTATIWQQTISVTPNTTYYFSGWAVSLNTASPYANIQVSIKGLSGSTSTATTGVLPAGPTSNVYNSSMWKQLYTTWNSGNNTSVTITINNIQSSNGGKDVGIDDLEFRAVTSYLSLSSSTGTDAQILCANSSLTPISYTFGGDGSAPPVSGLPAGVSTTWNGNAISIIGNPITPGNYTYTVNQGATGCNTQTLTGTINAVPPTVKPILYNNATETSICYQGSGSVTMTNAGSVVGNITWETAPGALGVWTSVPNGNYTNLENPIYYRVKAKRTEQGCLEEISNVVWLRLSNIWTGAAGTNVWNTTGNWADNKLPNNSCPVTYINAQGSNPSPKILGTVSMQDLKIQTGKTLSLSSGATLKISGSISAPPNALDITSATIEFTGTASQNITGKIFKNRTIKDLVVNNSDAISGVVIGNGANDTLNITNTLTFGNNGRKLTTGDNLTLKSTASGTASIGILANNNIISGKVVVERYIPNHKAWHFFSAPTKGSTFNAAWQAGNLPGINNNTRPGYGTMLTGTAGKVGYDYVSPQSSLRFFDNVSNSYKEIGNTLTALVDEYKGYMVFVRGDRSVKPTDPGYSATTLYTKGILYTPAAPFPTISISPGRWELIGNPFASAIDLSKVKVTIGANESSLGTYYVWDPNLTSGPSVAGLGAFRSISGNIATPSGGNYVSGSIPNIQSGQAFFVKNTSATNSMNITIPENAKVAGSVVLTLAPNSNNSFTIPDALASIRGSLFRVLPDKTTALLDGTIILYHPTYNDDIDMWDAEKMPNPSSENMGMISHGQVFAIERKNLPKENDSILFKMNNYKVASYRFEFEGSHFDVTGLDAFLWDKFLNTVTPVPSNGFMFYDFDVKSSPTGSWDERRFSIFFKPSSVVPVTLTNIKAYTQNKDVMVEWTAATESNMKSYTVETSLDGKTFTTGGAVAAKNIDGTVYHWLDVAPVAGYHYYRILSTGLDGKVTYSKIVSVLVGGNASASISIYPNPIKDGVMNVQFENQEAGVYQLRVLNTVGQVMMTNTINHVGGNGSQKVKLPSTLVKGMYQVEVWKGNERLMSEKVVY